MERESTSSNPIEMNTIYLVENKGKPELIGESTKSWPNVKEESILEFSREIKTEGKFFEEDEDKELEATGNQFQIEHIELLEQDIKLEWKGCEPTPEGDTQPIKPDDEIFCRNKNLLKDNRYSEPNDVFNEKNLLNPIQKSKAYKCIKCEKLFINNRNLRVHTQSVHEKIKPFKCLKCDYSSGQKADLTKHLKSVHEKLKQFKCDSCDYACSEKGTLSRHIMAVHEKLKQFKCPNCDYECSRKGDLLIHIKSVHEKLKEFKCTNCEFAFVRKDIYTITLIKAVHEKLKQFQCPNCEYSASRKANLLTHINSIHVKLKEFKCPNCSYACSDKRYLSRHFKSVHTKLKDF